MIRAAPIALRSHARTRRAVAEGTFGVPSQASRSTSMVCPCVVVSGWWGGPRRRHRGRTRQRRRRRRTRRTRPAAPRGGGAAGRMYVRHGTVPADRDLELAIHPVMMPPGRTAAPGTSTDRDRRHRVHPPLPAGSRPPARDPLPAIRGRPRVRAWWPQCRSDTNRARGSGCCAAAVTRHAPRHARPGGTCAGPRQASRAGTMSTWKGPSSRDGRRHPCCRHAHGRIRTRYGQPPDPRT